LLILGVNVPAKHAHDGHATVTGDIVLGQRFVDLFALPVFSND
jgi:hypothetical protein